MFQTSRPRTRRRALVGALILGSLACGAASEGHADPAYPNINNRVRKVELLYRQLYYDDAVSVCRGVLDAGRNSRPDLIHLLFYKALLAAIQGRGAEATETFKRVLVIDPTVQLDARHPPRVARAFEAAARWLERARPLQARLVAPASVKRGGPLEVRLEIESDPLDTIQHAALYVRAAGGGAARAHPAARSAGLTWSVPTGEIEGMASATSLECYVTAMDESYNEVLGREAQAITLLGPPAARPMPSAALTGPAPPPAAPRASPPGTPWTRRWWVWVSAGAVVLTAVAVGVGVAASRPENRVDGRVTIEFGRSP